MATNDEVADRLAELASLTELEEGDPNAFRVRAYVNAERAVRGLTRPAEESSATELAELRGIGAGIAERIREYVDTGRIAKLDELRERHPAAKRALLDVPGLGPKTVQQLDDELGVRDVDALAEALEDGRVAGLAGMGERSAAKLREAISELGLTSKQRRIPIAVALPLAERLVERLKAVPGVGEVAYAGSLRRFCEDVGDIDLLVATDDAGERVHEWLRASSEVQRVIGSGSTKTSVVTHDGVQVDLRVVPPASFGAALVYFTGSKAHNIRLRQRAQQRGWSLNEYGLASSDAPAVTTEEAVYAALDLPWIAPECREDTGEIEAAEAGRLGPLTRTEDLRGDLHDHTDLSGDGVDSLADLVDAAAARGLEYLAITDHAEGLRMNGVDRDAMLAQRDDLRRLQEERGDIALLHGAELNIGLDGSLDYDDGFLATFDWLVASVHSHLDRTVEEQTERVLAAIRHPSVTAIGHLSARLIGRRPPIRLDVERVLDAAADTGTAIEVNAALQRLDASVEVIREGERRGVEFVVSTDAHAVADLDRLRFGAAQVRRARLDPACIVNTRPWEGFRAWLDERRGG